MLSRRSLSFVAPLGLLAALAAAPAAHAAVTTYTSAAAFGAALAPGFYLETFDSLPAGTLLSSPLSFSSGGFSYTASTGTANGFFNPAFGTDVALSTNTSPDPIIFTFTGADVTAVGGNFFTVNNANALDGQTIIATLNDGISPTVLTLSGTGLATFGGFTSTTPLVSLTLQAVTVTSGTFTFPTANNLIVGSAITPSADVPEPGSAALALSALVPGAILAIRRRRAG